IVTDCDLEDPPEEIPHLWAKAQEGFDVVLSRRRRRQQALYRRVGARGYRALANILAGVDVDPELTNLSIVSRQVVDEFLRLRDHLDRRRDGALHRQDLRAGEGSPPLRRRRAPRVAGWRRRRRTDPGHGRRRRTGLGTQPAARAMLSCVASMTRRTSSEDIA